MLQIRIEQAADQAAIHQVLTDAFETDDEARLVDALRTSGCDFLSLVAEEHGDIVGQILFTPVTLNNSIQPKISGLAPLAVATAHQGRGVGSRLIEAGLKECEKHGYEAVVVLGNPNYYGRFGFKTASEHGIESVYDVEDPYFMVLELQPGILENKSGLARYHEAFADF